MERAIVVGKGVVGASAAYHLARAGVQVTLVDRGVRGQATDAGAGIISPSTDEAAPAAWYEMAFRAVAAYPKLLEQLAEDDETKSGYEEVGELFVATDGAEEARLEGIYQLVQERKRQGVHNIGEIARMSASEARSLFPALREDTPALYISGAARVNGRLLRDAMERALYKRGGSFRRGDARLARGRGRITGVEVGGETLRADCVILAAGAWSRQIAAAVGLELHVCPQRGQILHLEMPGAHAGRWPIVTGFHSHYMLTFPESRVVVGATRENDVEYDYRVTAGGTYEVLREALRIAPGLAAGTVLETRVGFRPVSPDGLPLFGRPSNLAGLVVATGLGPTGLTMGPYLGALAADLVRDQRMPLDIGPYDPFRFSPGGAPLRRQSL